MKFSEMPYERVDFNKVEEEFKQLMKEFGEAATGEGQFAVHQKYYRLRDKVDTMMTIAQIMEKMIAFSEGNIHDITHLSCVWTYAKTIGELEGLDADTQFILEVAAITHDIACPLCRKKYGNTNGKYQEQEGAPLVREFLADTGMTAEQIDRVAYLVGHHHSPAQIDGIDYQILIEADYIVNASESGYDQQAIRTFMEHTMKTAAGIRLTKTVFGV